MFIEHCYFLYWQILPGSHLPLVEEDSAHSCMSLPALLLWSTFKSALLFMAPLTWPYHISYIMNNKTSTLQKLHYNTQLIPVISISGSDTKIISSQSLSKTYWIKARAQNANAMHIPSITWLMLCDDPELQLSPLQQLSLVKTPHETCDVEHLGICCALLSQLDVFGSLHLL